MPDHGAYAVLAHAHGHVTAGGGEILVGLVVACVLLFLMRGTKGSK
jgi:hypothetical protein